jgi:hypothetical protein
MSQRITGDRQLYYGVESTEGVEVFGGGANALKYTNLVVSPDIAYYARHAMGAMGAISGKIGAQTNPTLRFTCDLHSGGITAIPDYDPLLAVVLSPKVNNSGVATTISAATDGANFTLTSAAGLTVGNAIAVETSSAGVYEVGWIQLINTGTNQIVLTDALTFTPANGKNVKGSATYNPQNTGHGSLSFQIYLDSGDRISFRGCKGSAKIDMPAPSATGKITFTFQAIDWGFSSAARPTPSYSSATAQTSYKFKVGATDTNIKLASCRLNQLVVRKTAQSSSIGTFAQVVVDRAVDGEIQCYDIDDSQFTNWTSGQFIALAQQCGSSQYNTIAYQVRQAQRRGVEYKDDNGQTADQIAFGADIVTGADEIRVAFL